MDFIFLHTHELINFCKNFSKILFSRKSVILTIHLQHSLRVHANYVRISIFTFHFSVTINIFLSFNNKEILLIERSSRLCVSRHRLRAIRTWSSAILGAKILKQIVSVSVQKPFIFWYECFISVSHLKFYYLLRVIFYSLGILFTSSN